MKITFQLPALLIIALTMMACGGEVPRKFTVKEYTVYDIDSSGSQVSWERSADYKVINKKVKLFGSYVTVNLENMEYTTSGNTPVIGGWLVMSSQKPDTARLEMDFSICRFYSEEEEAFLTTDQYPPAIVQFTRFLPDSAGYTTEAVLTLRDSVKNIAFPVKLEYDSLKNLRLTGTYTMQTLDWPIRENPDRANIRKDEIAFRFNLLLKIREEVRDTIYEPEEK